jgi:hypothetical protein
MSGASLHSLLERARPADPRGAVLEGAAVRVLARVAVLQGLEPVAVPTLRRRVSGALAAAALVVVVLASPAGDRGGTERSAPDPSAPCAGPWACVVAPALGGDAAARRRLREMGAAGRELLWSAAETGRYEALHLLRGWGRLRDGHEMRRAANLALRPEAAPEALDLLASGPAADAAAPLGALLVERPTLEAPVVAALRRLATRGAREDVVRALLAGAVAGRPLAAAAAVELGSASTGDRLLVLLPASRFEDPALADALRRARPTVVARVLRRAEEGDDRALAWAAAAGLEGAVPLLFATAVGADLAPAWHALERIAQVGGTEAWLALARSTEAPAGARALELLAALGPAEVAALRGRALASVRDRPAALWALACASDAGLDALAGFGRRPACVTETLAALERSPRAGAAERLAALGAAYDSALPVVEALGRRLAAGHTDAGPALLALGRGGPRRAALEALFGAGEAGAQYLTLAARDPALTADVRALLARACGRTGEVPRGGGASAPPPPRRAGASRTL